MATTATKEISIPAIDLREITLKIIGDTPLIMHAWDEKVKQGMLDKMMGKAKSKVRETKNPVREFIYSMYWLAGRPDDDPTERGFDAAIKSGNARFGFPAIGFKAASVSAGFRSKITRDKVSMLAAFHINSEFVEIIGIPRMREDMVRLQTGVADIRYRGEFPDWSAEVTVKYNAGVLSDEQLANLFNLGGFACGIGEWRVEKGGQYGMYHVG